MTENVQDHLPPNLLPRGMTRAAFIAGGYAACPELATDIDVWVMVDPTKLYEERRRILTHLVDHGFIPCAGTDAPVKEEFTGDRLGYEDITANILKVAEVWRGNQKPIHIMVTDAPALMLLLNFDISTHAIAFTDNGTIRAPEWTPLHMEPIIVKNHMTRKTQDRFNKINARYAHLRKAA